VYGASVHGQLLREGDSRAPVCTSCHAGHGISRTDTPGFVLDVVNECGDCHNNPDLAGDRRVTYYETYRLSYHGQVTELGSTRAACCSDCHGYHDIAPLDDPASRVHPERLVATCGQSDCHPGANSQFVKFDPHADYRDAERYPVLYGVWLYFMVVMSGAFGFFGLHTILWFLRSLVDRIRHGPHPKTVPSRREIRRFTALDRINHAFVVITFFGLTITGIPLLFSDDRWAAYLADLCGGIVLAGTWHRCFAVLLIINLIVHFVGIVIRFKRRKGTIWGWLFGPDTMLPAWSDVKSCAAMFRWFFRGGKLPRFGRWTYWEKFDYWCEIGGTGIIGGSGLLLMFPVISSHILPGWIFNAAMVAHGYEALLAVGFIFTIHFFNANLRMGKFPVDPVMFSGSVQEKELEEEHAAEYERLRESGELQKLRVRAWPKGPRIAFTVIGVLAMSIGIGLLALIILAGLDVL